MRRFRCDKSTSMLTLIVLAMVFARTASAAPPNMPARFDRPTVQAMVDNAERDHNAQLLKVRYFNARTRPALAWDDGYGIINAALGVAAKGSNRWFCLESLKAYAALRLSIPATADGFAAYNEVFDSAGLAKDPDAAKELQRAVKEYVFTVLGAFHDLGLQSDPRCQNTLVKAWSAYNAYLSANASTGPDPEWEDAVKVSGSEGLFAPLLAQSRSTETSKSFDLLVSSASILAASSPKQALFLLDAAKRSLPKDRVSQDRYYDLLVQSEKASGNLKAAIALQKERIDLTAHGYGLLLWLCASAKDWKAVSDISAKFAAPGADQVEINGVANALANLGPADMARNAWGTAQATKILETYLGASAKRDVEQDLHARVTLATIYEYRHDLDRAANVVDIHVVNTHLPLPPGKSAYYAREMAAVRDRIARRRSDYPSGDKSK